MANRDHNKEEPTEVRAPEITLCANRCGFPGNPATHNLCQNCFLARPASPSRSPSPSSSSMPAVSVSTPVLVVDRPTPAPEESSPAACAASVDRAPATEVVKAPAKSSVNRCSSCRKRVGLTGFRCRCDRTFCGEHRYSDRHGCSFDYKAAARDAIARDNPVVRAAKIVRF